jgi:coenzyme F420-0:L-glutamate ligase/coenzyme F420-1:gamma-L-glutamate ligase
MGKEIKIIGLKGIPLINSGDNIADIIITALNQNKLNLENKDILVISETFVSKSNGRIRDLKSIKPSKKAIDLYNKITPKAKKSGIPIKPPELIQAILDESKEIIKAEHVLITETKHGFICANAGIDKSNVEGKYNVALLPENPDEDAEKIRKQLKFLTNKDVAIIISDSFGRPFRDGAVGVAVGVSGINAILDKRGEKDLFGYELQSKIIGQVDNLTSAAQLVMGETDEGLPIILIKGYDFEIVDGASIKSILRNKDQDLFRAIEKNCFIDIMKNRRSYKLKFDPKDVDIKIIEECIEIARWAPSAHNGQFWRYVLLEKGELRENLIDAMNKEFRNDLKKDGRSEIYIKNKIDRSRNNFLDAPLLVFLCLDKAELEKYKDEKRSQNEFILGIQSVSCSATYLLLAFQINHLASCWYCAPLFVKQIVKKFLKLPESFIPMALFTVGYPLDSMETPDRKQLSDIIYKIR